MITNIDINSSYALDCLIEFLYLVFWNTFISYTNIQRFPVAICAYVILISAHIFYIIFRKTIA